MVLENGTRKKKDFQNELSESRFLVKELSRTGKRKKFQILVFRKKDFFFLKNVFEMKCIMKNCEFSKKEETFKGSEVIIC